MSATDSGTAFDFKAKAEELLTVLEHARESADVAEELARKIQEAAKQDNYGGLPRLGEAVVAEAGSFADVIHDWSFGPDIYNRLINDAVDLVQLVELATGKDDDAR